MAGLPSLNIITGPLLVGTWVSSLLYSAEVGQVIKYFRTFPDDDWQLKSFVLLCWLVDTVAAVEGYAAVYLYTITHASDAAYLSRQNWTFPLLSVTTGVVAALVQCFLVVRYLRFSRNFLFSLFLFLVIGLALTASIIASVVVSRYPLYTDRGRLERPATLWIVSQAVTDVIIALALLWEFRKARSVFCDTQSVLNRLARQTIQTGGATATVATATLVAYLVNKESNGIVPGDCIFHRAGLSNLNARKRLAPGISRSDEAITVTALHFHSDGAPLSELVPNGINVHHNAGANIDPEHGTRGKATLAPNRARSNAAGEARTESDSDRDDSVKGGVWFTKA
ncbi:hypothetical protein MIND_00653000 [Mycena indigotica]|uniref:DUF6534 domain-containing protein n=1 Tax=Mycena indigotica TaxID=2126181 RepID=A0A8H6SS40_9AGAR|nr:uncharacterized protein MIND_00653000 [Mycena indigotica]KAF7304208.1 hypothetical protein MIND_00653000 [Mycena indigotica]